MRKQFVRCIGVTMKKIFGVFAAATLLTGCIDNEGGYAFNEESTNIFTESTTQTTGQEFPTTVYFEFSKDQLSENALKILDAHAEFLAANEDKSIVIEGHTDARGAQSFNLGLSQRRARAISSYLLSKGVSQDQITEVSFGKEKLISENHDLNRRAEIIYQS